MLQTIGEDLLARDETGRLRARIATIFPRARIVVTIPGIHATQRVAYLDAVSQRRAAEGKPPLTDDEEEKELMTAVDLVIEDDAILIRPDPADMGLAFEADELLQQITSKKRIKFLHVMDPSVREAIRRRGERWRFSPLPRSPEQMKRMIKASRIGIGGREIYYYNKTTGTRILTLQEFDQLAGLPDQDLRGHLLEICGYCSCRNRLGSPEIDFFMARPSASSDRESGTARSPLGPVFEGFAPALSGECDPRHVFSEMRRHFRRSVPAQFNRDELDSPEWRSQMYAALIERTDQNVSEEALLGLSAEFFMQIEWLPGGRIEEGELLLDNVFEEEESHVTYPGGATAPRLSDERARGLIVNFIREYGDLEYVNIGRVVGSLYSNESPPGASGAEKRYVYLAEIKRAHESNPILRILRMQKWCVPQHLDQGKDLLTAMLESEEYTDYILDRRLGCRQLGMHLAPRVTARKVSERYQGRNTQYHGLLLRTTYFERDYVFGLATDKIAACCFADVIFANAFARALGRAAAPNVIVGRTDSDGNGVFDQGNELVVLDVDGIPTEVIVANHTGTFSDYRRDLREFLPGHASAILRRISWVSDVSGFIEAFIHSFVHRFAHIQVEHRKRRRAFTTLFKHHRRDEGGSFAYRWERVLARLDATDTASLVVELEQQFTRIPEAMLSGGDDTSVNF